MRRFALSFRFLALLLGTGLLIGFGQTMFSQSTSLRPRRAASAEQGLAKTGAPAATSETLVSAKAGLVSRYSRLPLAFERNVGQSSGRVLYLSRGLGYSLFLTSDEAAVALNPPAPGTGNRSKPEGVAISFVGASAGARVSGGDKLPGRTNYFLGRDSARWTTNVPSYATVTYKDIYPGVSLVFYGTQRQLEQDWVVAPGGDPAQIAFDVQGARKVALDSSGDLRIILAGGEMRLLKPVVYQPGGEHGRIPIQGSFELRGRTRIGFKLGAYNRSNSLIIDPVLAYSTYLGGSGLDEAHAIAVDAAGDVFVAGDTTSTDFPSTDGSVQPSCKLDSNDICERDAFVTEFAAGGATEVYSTYLGGSGSELTFGLAVDASGSAYVTGQTTSTDDFPTTANALQLACATADNTTSCLDAFVSKISSDGSSLQYSTYLGGSGVDSGNSIAVDASGDAFVAGQTASADFPTTTGVIQTLCGSDGNCDANGGIAQSDAFVAEINTNASGAGSQPLGAQVSGNSLVYSTYLGGSGIDYATAIAIDASGDAFVAGGSSSADLAATSGVVQPACKLDASSVCEGEPFVAELNPTATALTYLTYLGGSGGNGNDTAYGIALDASGDAYVVGQTSSADFPVTAGAFQSTCGTDSLCNPVSGAGTSDGFLAKLNSGATALVYSSFLGGSGLDLATAVAVDSSGAAYVAGATYSSDFPTSNALSSGTALVGGEDAFVAAFNTTGSGLMFSTYLGGSGNDVAYGLALDSSADVFVAGSTASADLPTLNPFQASNGGGTDAFVAEIGSAASPFAQLSAASLSFGDVLVGTSSASQSITVTNTGNADLLVSDVTLGGSNPADFSLTGDTCTDSSVAPAGTCVLTVTFTPAAAGARSATLTVSSNASNGAQVASLTGNGISLSVSLTPPVLSYSSQIVGTSSAAQNATLTNTGTQTVDITGISLTGANSGDFASTTTCGGTLAVGASCTISATFTPTAGGTRTATISVSDNATGSPQTVALTGQGADFQITIWPPAGQSAIVPAGRTGVFNLVINPYGGFNHTVNVTCAGAPQQSTCTINPSANTPLNGTTPVDVSVDVATTAPGFAPMAHHRVPPLGPLGGKLLVLGVVGLGMLALLARKRPAILLLALAMLFVMAWASCGGSNIPTFTKGAGTPAGSYTITVTATSSGLTRTITGNLVVQ